MIRGNVMVGQSGGPTSVINASLVGVFKTAKDEGCAKVYGMRNGIEGFLDGRIVDLGEIFKNEDGTVNEEKLQILSQTPAAGLGSCRRKLPDPAQDEAFFDRLIEKFREHDVRYFFYIGGNDSMDTVEKLSRYIAAHDYPMRVVGLPKTIDNDLPGTDHAPGFGCAAKFIASQMQEIVRDCAVYTVPAVTIVDVTPAG